MLFAPKEKNQSRKETLFPTYTTLLLEKGHGNSTISRDVASMSNVDNKIKIRIVDGEGNAGMVDDPERTEAIRQHKSIGIDNKLVTLPSLDLTLTESDQIRLSLATCKDTVLLAFLPDGSTQIFGNNKVENLAQAQLIEREYPTGTGFIAVTDGGLDLLLGNIASLQSKLPPEHEHEILSEATQIPTITLSQFTGQEYRQALHTKYRHTIALLNSLNQQGLLKNQLHNLIGTETADDATIAAILPPTVNSIQETLSSHERIENRLFSTFSQAKSATDTDNFDAIEINDNSGRIINNHTYAEFKTADSIQFTRHESETSPTTLEITQNGIMGTYIMRRTAQGYTNIDTTQLRQNGTQTIELEPEDIVVLTTPGGCNALERLLGLKQSLSHEDFLDPERQQHLNSKLASSLSSGDIQASQLSEIIQQTIKTGQNTFDSSFITWQEPGKKEIVCDTRALRETLSQPFEYLPYSVEDTEALLKQFPHEMRVQLLRELISQEESHGQLFARICAIVKYNLLPGDLVEWFNQKGIATINSDIIVELRHAREELQGACEEVGAFIIFGYPFEQFEVQKLAYQGKIPTAISKKSYTPHLITNGFPHGQIAEINIWEKKSPRLRITVTGSYIAGTGTSARGIMIPGYEGDQHNPENLRAIVYRHTSNSYPLGDPGTHRFFIGHGDDTGPTLAFHALSKYLANKLTSQ